MGVLEEGINRKNSKRCLCMQLLFCNKINLDAMHKFEEKQVAALRILP